MPRKTPDAVVVITGASSGIGRATALEFARHGHAVVLAARREGPLQELAQECERVGGRSLAVPTDVTKEEAVQDLARRTVERFGRIDVWVNNAAVALFARFEEAPPEAYRRVIETNLMGYIHGARAALPHMRKNGSGVIINNASMVAAVGQPFASAYVTAKFGVRGFSECLRMELRDTDIHVCVVMPASIDTPLFQHAANYTGRATKAMNPVYDAEKVARTIVRLADRPKRETFVGNPGRMLAMMHGLAPPLAERMIARQVEVDHFQDRPAPATSGNLFEAMSEGTGVSGGWKGGDGVSSRIRSVAAAGLAASVPAIAVWWWLRPGKNGRRAMPIAGRSRNGLKRILKSATVTRPGLR